MAERMKRIVLARRPQGEPVLDVDRRADAPDTVEVHAAMTAACDAHDPDWHARFKAWCDEYFFLPHRNEPRGTGGIFYDHHDSGDWNRDFAFTRDVGEAFLDVYSRIVYSAHRHNVRHVFAAGRQLVRDGALVLMDLDRILHRARHAQRDVVARMQTP